MFLVPHMRGVGTVVPQPISVDLKKHRVFRLPITTKILTMPMVNERERECRLLLPPGAIVAGIIDEDMQDKLYFQDQSQDGNAGTVYDVNGTKIKGSKKKGKVGFVRREKIHFDEFEQPADQADLYSMDEFFIHDDEEKIETLKKNWQFYSLDVGEYGKRREGVPYENFPPSIKENGENGNEEEEEAESKPLVAIEDKPKKASFTISTKEGDCYDVSKIFEQHKDAFKKGSQGVKPLDFSNCLVDSQLPQVGNRKEVWHYGRRVCKT